ncbi:MAG: hypothetical protein KBD94_03355 [Pyrinomonadaceae bacterium]|nr:hypothetical protein [Pyrinomonadaceae bacterium]
MLLFILACTPWALIDFAVPKWKADKNVRIEDAYKYINQATRGGEHAVPDRTSAGKWLDNEWSNLGPAQQGEVTWEPLCPGGEIGRLHLRPFRSAGGKADALLDAFLASASAYKTEPSTFTDAWAELGKRLKKGSIGSLDHEAWKQLDAQMKKKNYPAIHHSDEYQEANHPAYRILTGEEARQIMP